MMIYYHHETTLNLSYSITSLPSLSVLVSQNFFKFRHAYPSLQY